MKDYVFVDCGDRSPAAVAAQITESLGLTANVVHHVNISVPSRGDPERIAKATAKILREMGQPQEWYLERRRRCHTSPE